MKEKHVNFVSFWDIVGLRTGPPEVNQSFAVDSNFDHGCYFIYVMKYLSSK